MTFPAPFLAIVNHASSDPVNNHLTLSDLLPDALCALPGVEMLALFAVHNLWRLLHDLLAFGENELDVAWIGPGNND